MKPIKSLIMAAFLLLPLAAPAQYRRDRDWSSDREYRSGNLDEIADTLSDRAQHVWSMVRGQRFEQGEQNVDLRNALRNFSRNTRNLAAQLNNTDPEAYRPRAQGLIRQAEDISRLFDQSDSTNHVREDWTQVEEQVYRLGQFYGIPFSPESRQSRYYRRNETYGRNRELARTDPYYGYDNPYGRHPAGTFRWRGSVDGSDLIYLRGSEVRIQHVDAQPITNSSYLLPVPLPQTAVNLQLNRLQGRGHVQMLQQPSPQNNYTAVVRIDDPDAGRDYYEFELTW